MTSRDTLLEYKLQQGVLVYHRSQKQMSPGKVIYPRGRGSHDFERIYEEVRIKVAPGAPSRLDCIYGSFVPRSRFFNFGTLYVVKPIGNTFIADSTIIDRGDDSEREIKKNAIEYWKGVEPDPSNVNDVEVLMESAVVVEVVEEPRKIDFGTIAFRVTGEIPKLRAKVGDFVILDALPEEPKQPMQKAAGQMKWPTPMVWGYVTNELPHKIASHLMREFPNHEVVEIMKALRDGRLKKVRKFSLLEELIRETLLAESILQVKKPTTPEQEKSFIELLKWVSSKMEVPEDDVRDAVRKAAVDDWNDALDIVQTYYAMKGVTSPRSVSSSPASRGAGSKR